MTSDSELINEIKKIFLEVFPTMKESEFDLKKKQQDYDNWDSFAQLNLITLTESKFNVSFSLDESIEIISGEDLFRHVKSHMTC